MKSKHLKFFVSEKSGEVSGVYTVPDKAAALYVFAHGAGAPMDHPFMNKAAELLAEQAVASLRYNFPYTEKKSKSIDSKPVLLSTIKAAVEEGKKLAGGIPVFAGGKSMGGRMTSMLFSTDPVEGVKGIIFFGFPLHAPGKDSSERADHLYSIKIPMLFLQGTRDKLANLDLLKPVIKKLGSKATLEIFDGADHSFHVLKSSGKSDDEVLKEIVLRVRSWCKETAVLNKTAVI